MGNSKAVEVLGIQAQQDHLEVGGAKTGSQEERPTDNKGDKGTSPLPGVHSGEGYGVQMRSLDLACLHSDLLPVPPTGNQEPASMGSLQGTEPGGEGQRWMDGSGSEPSSNGPERL